MGVSNLFTSMLMQHATHESYASTIHAKSDIALSSQSVRLSASALAQDQQGLHMDKLLTASSTPPLLVDLPPLLNPSVRIRGQLAGRSSKNIIVLSVNENEPRHLEMHIRRANQVGCVSFC